MRPVLCRVAMACSAVALFAAIAPIPASSRPLAAGDQMWAKRYDGKGHLSDYAYSVAVSPDGSTVYVTGAAVVSAAPINQDYVTLAYDATTGTKLWSKSYDGSGSSDSPVSVAVSPDGTKVVVTGLSYNASGDKDYATLAYDATTGTKLWRKNYTGLGPGDDTPDSVVVSLDSTKVFVTGRSPSLSGDNDYLTIAYDAATGAKQWDARYDDTIHGNDNAQAIAVSPDGTQVFVTGSSPETATSTDYATVAYDAAAGVEQWHKTYDGTGAVADGATSLGASPDGSTVFVTGSSGGSSGDDDYVTIAYDTSAGALAWRKRYTAPGSSDDGADSLAVSPDGAAVFVTGDTMDTLTFDVDSVTVGYDAATGTKLWTKRYDGSAHDVDRLAAVGVSPDGGTVFSSGYSVNSAGDNDFITIAYDAVAGTKLWDAVYDGGHDDSGLAHAMSPDGTAVFVTGPSQDSGAVDWDYATVAFSTS